MNKLCGHGSGECSVNHGGIINIMILFSCKIFVKSSQMHLKIIMLYANMRIESG